MPGSRVLMVSIDGVAPRAITGSTMPRLVDLARRGAACWSARTVVPSVTLPAHTSMLRGVDPTVHGIVDNDATETSCDAPSILRHARAQGLRTAAVYAWTPMNATIESNATTERIVFDSGYDPADDEHVTLAALDILTNDRADLLFVDLAEGDLAGHDHGWMSDDYLQSLSRLDAKLGRMIDALRPDDGVLVTTDHGGQGHDHGDGRPEDLETFVAAASPEIAAASWWRSASITDVPATVAGLCGIAAADGWGGQTLLGCEVPTIEIVMTMLQSMRDHRYGEYVNMLDHSLQTAALARQSKASDEMIAAALLHDIGHVCDETALVGDLRWGVPNHAEIAGRFLQQILPSVSETVRLHVDAKRFLVATDSDYASTLSEASTITLEQQGGPFNADEAERFAAAVRADDAIRLRRWDDSGKVDGLMVDPLDHYQPLLTSLLEPSSLSGSWCRDACTCSECRDPQNHQHLIDVADLAGWNVVDSSPGTVTVSHADGRSHRCEIPRSTHPRADGETRTWDAAHLGYLVERSAVGLDEPALAQLVNDLDQFGIALMSGVPCRAGRSADGCRIDRVRSGDQLRTTVRRDHPARPEQPRVHIARTSAPHRQSVSHTLPERSTPPLPAVGQRRWGITVQRRVRGRRAIYAATTPTCSASSAEQSCASGSRMKQSTCNPSAR